jgi:hypothetical protein
MNNNFVIFNKEREFGDLFNAIFLFFRQNAKMLGLSFLFFVAPFVAIDGIISALTQVEAWNWQKEAMYDNYYYNPSPYAYVWELIGWYILMMALKMLSLSVTYSMVYSYINLYIQKGPGNFDLNNVRTETFKNLLSMLGTMFVGGIILGIGLVLCIIPGIYLAIAMSFIFWIIIYEKAGFGAAMSRSFTLAHRDFWWSLLIYFVMALLTGVIGALVSLPNTLLSTFVSFNSISGNPSDSMQGVFMGLHVITTVVSGFIGIFLPITIALQYFNIVEKTEAVSLSAKLDNMIDHKEP